MVQKKLVELMLQNKVLNTEWSSLTLVYVDSTKGWINVQN